MFEIFGIPSQALFGQLLLGLINGSFYALLSLGLAVIFGMLNIINFTHGAQYMLGAFAAYLLLQHTGHRLLAGADRRADRWSGIVGMIIERIVPAMALQARSPLRPAAHFRPRAHHRGRRSRNYYGSAGLPYPMPESLRGGQNLGFMFLPNYRAWVIVASLAVCLGTWFVIERTRLGAYLRAATENPTLVRAFGINVPRMITLTYGFGVGLAALAGVMAAPIYNVSPQMGSVADHRGVRRGGDRRHGLDHGRDRHRLRPRRDRGTDQGVLSGSLQHGDLRHHGDRAAGAAGRPVRKDRVMAVATDADHGARALGRKPQRGDRVPDHGRGARRSRRSSSIRCS